MSEQNLTEFKPTKKQLDFLQAYINAPLDSTLEDICKLADVSRTSQWEWRKDSEYNKWFNEQIKEMMVASLTEVWRGLLTRAKDNYNDARLFLQRFDTGYIEKKELQMPELMEKITIELSEPNED